VLDILPFDADRLVLNAWASDAKLAETFTEWSAKQYTQADLCGGDRWPFPDKSFSLGLCSHCLEDIRDPIQVVREINRVCEKCLIICPSRLFEQMRGVDHPNYAGMTHHLWLVYDENGVLYFRRKTQLIEFPGNHLHCPFGSQLSIDAGSMYYISAAPLAKEVVFFEASEDCAEYKSFVRANKNYSAKLDKLELRNNWRKWYWFLRQKYRWEV
jgi:SAM-dependent methyltransferase